MRSLLFICFALFASSMAVAQSIVLPKNEVKRGEKIFHFGKSTNPQGVSIEVDSRGFIIGGHPVIPVMGEIHFSRIPEEKWRDEIRKMKSGGVTIAATYIFWNHHEFNEGEWNWSGNRNLRRFVEICGEEQMPIVLRVGPFCHGEVYQGGFPDWIVEKSIANKDSFKLRSLAIGFINAVDKLYRNIAQQVDGLLWKDGGAVIGVQIENESRGPWSYLARLKELAVNAGFDVPFFTRTGWPKLNGNAVFGEILPLYGDYADGFWDRKLTDMPSDYPNSFVFKNSRLSSVIATETFGNNQDTQMDGSDLSYPYLTCELGGGMMPSYHRRINMDYHEALALAICKVGSGSNLPGYYMYHGGTNPISELHTMAETQNSPITNYNDMPHVTYDFQAPLGEFGLPNPSYFELRPFHLMLKTWGESLSSWDAVFPTTNDENGHNDNQLRWTVRSDGQHGFVFVNNYQRLRNLSDKQNVQFDITLSNGERMIFPQQPITVLNGTMFCLPFNIECLDVNIDWAMAQLYTYDAEKSTIYLMSIDGINPQISIDGVVSNFKTSMFTVKNKKGQDVNIKLLTPHEAQCTFFTTQGNFVASKRTNVMFATSENGQEQIIVEKYKYDTSKILKVRQIQETFGLRDIQLGAQKVAAQPVESDFDKASVWQINIDSKKLSNKQDLSDSYIEITYQGDVARVYADGKLIEDNFWNGKPFLVRLSDLINKKVEIKILPLGKNFPIYLQEAQRKRLADSEEYLLSLDSAKLLFKEK